MNPVGQDSKRRDAQKKHSDDADELVTDGEAAVVARRRVFLLLEAHRESLAARVWRRFRVRRRYEDLCLVKRVTRLQRDYLSQPTPGAKHSANDTGIEYGIADWARPWGPTFLLQFQADLNVFDAKLKSSRKWLPTATQRRAEARAAKRFASITAGMASQLKAAEFALPSWASSRQRSRQSASQRASRRAESGASEHNGRRAAKDPRLNLNLATFAELRSLNLTSTQTQRLLAYRKRIGGYKSLEQLDEVPGFPSVVRERLKRQATV